MPRLNSTRVIKVTRLATIAALPARLFISSIVFQGSHGCLFGLLDFYKTNHNIVVITVLLLNSIHSSNKSNVYTIMSFDFIARFDPTHELADVGLKMTQNS